MKKANKRLHRTHEGKQKDGKSEVKYVNNLFFEKSKLDRQNETE